LSSQKQTFDNNFEVFLADTPGSKEIHYNLRYQVYCEEMGFEDKELFQNQMESDEWDDKFATHFLVRHKGFEHWIGGLRLVFENNGSFPFEQWSKSHNKIENEPERRAVEMSRLCVIKEARKFNSKRFAPLGLPNDDIAEELVNVKSIFNYKNHNRSLMWGLIKAAANYSYENNIENWYFVIAPSLALFLTKGGLKLSQIGEPCDHRGLRIPYSLTVENVLENPLWINDYKMNYRLYSELSERLVRKA
jgi:N-acyl amino acid synthase of PEP-CTERM/exosortase system